MPHLHPFVSRVLPLVLTVLLAAPVLATGATLPWDGGAFAGKPAEMLAAAAAIPAPAEAEVQMLLAETELVVEADGLRRYRQRLVYRVLKPGALPAWATVESPWSPWYQRRPEIRARVITAEGRVHELDPATVGEAPGAGQDPQMFRDTRELRAPLPAAAVGAVVETEVRIGHEEPFFADGETRRHWLAMTVPVVLARGVIETPEGLDLRIETGGFEGEPTVERVDGPGGPRVRRTWELEDVEPVRIFDPGLPSDAPIAPYLAFSTGSSWAKLAQSYSALVDRQIGSSTEHAAELAVFAGEGGDELSSQWERIQQLVASLHRQVRYTGVQFGDAGIVPRAPHETLARRFGDCKDKAVLLTSLLRREGIPAYLALLNAGPGPDALSELPGLGLFDHAIVYVPGGSPLWIDATDPYSPLGELPAGDEDRWALVASPNTSGLIRTPASDPEDNQTHEVREIFLSPLGTARVVETSEMRGEPAHGLRADWAEAEPEEIRAGLEDYVSDTYGATKLTRFEHTPPADTTLPLKVEVEAEGASYGTTDFQEAVALLRFGSLFEKLPGDFFPEDGEVTPRREHDYVLLEPYRTVWDYRLHLPENLELRELPEDFETALGPATFSQRFERSEDGRTVTAHVLFDTGKRRYTPEEVTAFQTAVVDLNDQDRATMLVWFDQTVQARLASQGVTAAVTEARRLIGLDPDRALPHALLARALLAGGLGNEARRAAEQAAKVEPEAAIGHQLLAWTLVHDEVGRQFRPGFDREAAMAAYRRALELDPDNQLIRTDYAILLEHDAEGIRYSKGADLDEAIVQYRKALESGDNEQIVNNLLIALMWAERFEDLDQELERHSETPGRRFLSILTEAVLDSPEAALRTARRKLADPGTRVEALSTAARHLMLLRHYKPAAALFHGAGRDGANAATLLAMGEMLDRMRPFESLEPDPTTLEGWFQTLLIEVVRPQRPGEDGASRVERLVGLLAPSLRQEAGSEDSEHDLALFDSLLESDPKIAEIPREVFLDLVLSSVSITLTEETPHGSRATARFSLGGQSEETESFLIREGGVYRLVAADQKPGVAGYEVLYRLDHGDVDGARVLLDWLHDRYSQRVDPTEPLAGALLHRFWPPKREESDQPVEPTEEEMRIAAAVELATLDQEDAARKALPLLERVRATAPERQSLGLDLALLTACTRLESWQQARPIAERLFAAVPDSGIAFRLLGRVLDSLKDGAALERVSRQRLELDPDDFLARLNLYEAALLQDDPERALSILVEILQRPSPSSLAFNNAAWYKLVLGRTDEEALRWAQEAAERSSYRDRPTLHTLASIYAELGRPAEAYRVLLQGMEVTQEPPDSADWYVLGRLAELYGLPDAARRYYQRVEPDQESSVDSVWSLARKRLQGLTSG